MNKEKVMDSFLEDITNFAQEIGKFNRKMAQMSLSRPRCNCRECSAERETSQKLLSRISE